MYYVYILTNNHNTVFYTGMTDDLIRRNQEHQYKIYNGFTKKYNISKLVYFESYQTHEQAIAREKIIKKWKRQYKINAIEEMNPYWSNLLPTLAEA